MKQLKFNVEELHRGKWQPIIVNDKDGKEVQKRVYITQEQADWNNKLSDAYKLRYVKAGGKAKDEPKEDLTELRAEYEALYEKKPYGAWDAEKLSEKIKEKKSK